MVELNATTAIINYTQANASVPSVLDPIINSLGNFVGTIQILVGGIFGLYLIFVIIQWLLARELKKTMKELRNHTKDISVRVQNIEEKLSKLSKMQSEKKQKKPLDKDKVGLA